MELTYDYHEQLAQIAALNINECNKKIVKEALTEHKLNPTFYNHVIRTKDYAVLIASLLDLNRDIMAAAAGTHDVGKNQEEVKAELDAVEKGKPIDMEKVKPHPLYSYNFITTGSFDRSSLETLICDDDDESRTERYMIADIVARHHDYQRERSYHKEGELPDTPYSFEEGSDMWKYAIALSMADFYEAYTATDRVNNWRKANEARGKTTEDVMVENLNPELGPYIHSCFKAGIFNNSVSA